MTSVTSNPKSPAGGQVTLNTPNGGAARSQWAGATNAPYRAGWLTESIDRYLEPIAIWRAAG